jgi:thiol-disulfide isomerase/thioredoxin
MKSASRWRLALIPLAMNQSFFGTFSPAARALLLAVATACFGCRVETGSLSAAEPRLGSELKIKFTSVEGQPVDLAALKGKVVLVDFWATWCGPCVAEVPRVKAVYDKFHAKGFEIVGISLDEDKARLQAFVKEKGMAWPQFFDGKGWENEICSRYSVESIPTMWLVDKEGKVADLNASRDLESKVAKLLRK